MTFQLQRKHQNLGEELLFRRNITQVDADYYSTFTRTDATDNNMFITYSAPFKAEEVNYVKVRLKNNSSGDTFKLEFGADAMTKTLGINVECWQIRTNEDQWCEYIFPVAENITSGKWEGDINTLRCHFVVNPALAAGESVSVDYIALFDTEENAKNFDIAAWEAANPAKELPEGSNPNAYPSEIIDFTKEADQKRIAFNSTHVETTFTAEGVVATAANGTTPSSLFKVDMTSYDSAYVKIKVKNTSSTAGIKIGFCGNFVEESLNGHTERSENFLPLDTNMTEFKEYIFKWSDYKREGVAWDYVGRMNMMRIDWMRAGANERATKGESTVVEYIAFFATKEQAESFDITAYRAGIFKPTVTVDDYKVAAPTTQRAEFIWVDPVTLEEVDPNGGGNNDTPATPTGPANTTTAATTTAKATEAATTAAATTAAVTTEAPKGGCGGSVALVGIGAIAALGAVVVSKKRR